MVEIPTRSDTIRQHRAGGGRVAAVFPVHYPRALLRAFGVLPVEVWGPPGVSSSSSDAHLQVYTCSIVRCGLSFILSGGLADRADLVVVPHACDSLQGLGSVLLDFLGSDDLPVLTLYLPRDGTVDASVFLAAELRSLAGKLSDIVGETPTDGRLKSAIELEERADALLGELAARRPPSSLSSRDYLRAARSREYLPAERFVELVAPLLEAPRRARPPDRPVILSGIVPEPMELLDAIDEAGGTVVADDLACCGRRLYAPGRAADPYERLAETLLGGPPDSTRGASIERRAEHLIELARRTSARAVIFHQVKFCEPEQFYLPLLRQALEAAGVRTLAIEVDLAEKRLPAQVVTRVEALLETIG